MFLTEQLVEPVLPLDQKLQAAFAVFHVEGKEVLHPGRELIRGLRFEFERCAVRARVDDALAHRPGVDDLGHHARQRGLRRHAPQPDDELGAEGAHGRKLEPHIGLVGKSGVARDMRVDLLAPAPQVVGGDRAIERGGHDLGHQLADMGTRAVDDRTQPPHLVVELDHAGEVVGHRLRARDIRQRAAQGGEEARDLLPPRRDRRRRVRIDVDEPAIDLAIGRPAVDRRDRLQERPVVEHRAVEEGCRGRIDVGAQMGREAPWR